MAALLAAAWWVVAWERTRYESRCHRTMYAIGRAKERRAIATDRLRDEVARNQPLPG